jgi:hypothetical protein
MNEWHRSSMMRDMLQNADPIK